MYQRGDVVLIAMPIIENSSVQGGYRPWVIVQNDNGNRHSPTTIVIPLTTKIKRLDLPTHVKVDHYGLSPCIALCEQVRVVDVSRIDRYVCTLPSVIMEEIDRGLNYAFLTKRKGESDG